jgi:2-aminoadipate transaminase
VVSAARLAVVQDGVIGEPTSEARLGGLSAIERDFRVAAEAVESAFERILDNVAPDVVVQAGTTSKTFFPGVRLGWAVGPATVIAQLVAAKQNTDQCAGALGQRLFEEYARRGLMDEQLERSRRLYQRRCERMLGALERHMSADVAWTRPEGGFFTWLTLPPALESAELTRSAAARGVAIVPGTPFFPDGRGGENVRLSFSRVEDELIDEGIGRLAALVADEGRRA